MSDIKAKEDRLIARALKVLAKRHAKGIQMANAQTTKEYFQLKLAEYKNEIFGALWLDKHHRVIEFNEMFQGTIDGAAVYPRIIVQRAMELNAGAVIFTHNHPSGIAEPSRADEIITRRLVDALKLVDVNVLDHIVVSVEGTTSFAEKGML